MVRVEAGWLVLVFALSRLRLVYAPCKLRCFVLILVVFVPCVLDLLCRVVLFLFSILLFEKNDHIEILSSSSFLRVFLRRSLSLSLTFFFGFDQLHLVSFPLCSCFPVGVHLSASRSCFGFVFLSSCYLFACRFFVCVLFSLFGFVTQRLVGVSCIVPFVFIESLRLSSC